MRRIISFVLRCMHVLYMPNILRLCIIMELSDVGMFLTFVQIPVSFWAVLTGHPASHTIITWANDKYELLSMIVSVPLQIPCLCVSILIVHTGLSTQKWKKMLQESASLDEITGVDVAVPGNLLFWICVLCFTWLKTGLLLHYIDMFALILTSIFSSVALFLSCRPVEQTTLGYRVTGIVAFVLSVVPMNTLALEHAKTTEVYVLFLCLCADSLLILGHTWDYPCSTLNTVINCRTVYMFFLQVTLPLSICASCEIF